MTQSHSRKRQNYRRRVVAALTGILNDPEVMPNADCDDLVVSVRDVLFGNTVRTIYVDFFGHWRNPANATNSHNRYMEVARSAGQETYVDLTDVAIFPRFLEAVADELKIRLCLQYRPDIRHMSEIGKTQ
jgi:hypothetical protein